MYDLQKLKRSYDQMPMKWILTQQYSFLRALLFVIMDLTNEVSSGAIDLAKSILEVLRLFHPTSWSSSYLLGVDHQMCLTSVLQPPQWPTNAVSSTKLHQACLAWTGQRSDVTQSTREAAGTSSTQWRHQVVNTTSNSEQKKTERNRNLVKV